MAIKGKEPRRCIFGPVIIKFPNMRNEICATVLFFDKISNEPYPLFWASGCHGNHVKMAGKHAPFCYKCSFLCKTETIILKFNMRTNFLFKYVTDRCIIFLFSKNKVGRWMVCILNICFNDIIIASLHQIQQF